MSTFTPEEVRRLAALARLELSPEEVTAFTRQLAEILAFAQQVQAVDGAAPEPDAIAGVVLPPRPPMRDDTLLPSLPRETVLAAAPDADRDAGLFKVPRVLNG
jgi:aspartyl-tRNA(Asn)/glutamyl-tRNA(Gln) amidotransferase subunit C